MGNAYYWLGDFTQAQDFHKRALHLAEALGNPAAEDASCLGVQTFVFLLLSLVHCVISL